MGAGPFFGRLLGSLRNPFSKPRPSQPGSLLEACASIARRTIPRINELLGLDYSGQVFFRVAEMDAPAATSGDVVTLGRKWFQDHPDDDGAIVHELVHVVMHCARMDDSNWWMIEGMADYARDKLGYTMPWSSPTRGDPRSGYQQTAHFLLFVEQRFGPGYIRTIASGLSASGSLPPDIDSKLASYLGGSA